MATMTEALSRATARIGCGCAWRLRQICRIEGRLGLLRGFGAAAISG